MTTTVELMRTYQVLKAQRDTITEQMEQTKALLAQALPDGGEVAGLEEDPSVVSIREIRKAVN